MFANNIFIFKYAPIQSYLYAKYVENAMFVK